MKTKIIFPLSLLLVPMLLLYLSLPGCKKSKDDSEDGSSSVDTTALADVSTDNENVKGAAEEAVMDANTVMSQKTTKSTGSLPCHMTVDSSLIVGDTITYTLTYNGYNCANILNRSGQIQVKRNINTPWVNAGSTVLIYFNNFNVTNINFGDQFILNGRISLQNVTGGRLGQVGTGIASITYKDWGAIAVTFSNAAVYTWNFTRQRIFTGTQGTLSMKSSGFGSQNGYDNLITWGTTRMGKLFYEQIPQFVEHLENCYFHGASGIDYMTLPNQNTKITSTYGFDKNHRPLIQGNCPGSFRIDWSVGSLTGSFFMDLKP